MNSQAKLLAPFSPEAVSWRVGSTKADKTSGLALAYIDARDVMDRLDDVVGPENWQNKYSHASGKVVCDIGIKIDGEWVWKADGAGDTDVEAEKGALSDAFKRAAVRWGIGRYLYNLGTIWVDLEKRGNSYVIAPSQKAKLEKHLRDFTARMVAPMTPVNSNGSAAQPLKRDEARALFKTLDTALRTCESDAAVMAFEHDNKAQIDLLGDWKIHVENAIAEHRQFLATQTGKAA